jgi:hypothetical protein
MINRERGLYCDVRFQMNTNNVMIVCLRLNERDERKDGLWATAGL